MLTQYKLLGFIGIGLFMCGTAWTEDSVPITARVVSAVGFGKSARTKLDQALSLLTKVLNSEEFKESVTEFTYLGKPQFVQAGMSNEAVYQALLNASENFKPGIDHIADFDLRLYTPPWYKKWSVVGYTYPNGSTIHMNRYYFDSFEVWEIAANLVHEWCHKLGFAHDYKRTKRRPFSVPYAIGDIVEDLGERMAEE